MDNWFALLPALITPMIVLVSVILPVAVRQRRQGEGVGRAAQVLGLEVEKRRGTQVADLKGYYRNRAVRIQFQPDPNGGLDVRFAIGGVSAVAGRAREPGEALPDWPTPTGDRKTDRAFLFKGSPGAVLAVAAPRVRDALATGRFRLEQRSLRWHYGRMSELDPEKLRAHLNWLMDFADAVGDGSDEEDRLRERATSDPVPEVRMRALYALYQSFPGPDTEALARGRVQNGDATEKLVASIVLGDTPEVLLGTQQSGAHDDARLWGLASLALDVRGEQVLASFLRSEAWFVRALRVCRDWKGLLPWQAFTEAVHERLDPRGLGGPPLIQSKPYDHRVERLGWVLEVLGNQRPAPEADALALDIAQSGNPSLRKQALDTLAERGLPGALETLAALREQASRDAIGQLDLAILAIQQRHELSGEAGQISLVGLTGDEGALSLPVEPAIAQDRPRSQGRRSGDRQEDRNSEQ